MPVRHVRRLNRSDLFKRWESETGFSEIMGDADESNLTLSQQLETMSPTDPSQHQYQAVEELLYRRGYDLYDDDDGQIVSSPMRNFGRWSKDSDVSDTDAANDRLLLDEHLAKSYSKTLTTGIKTRNLLLMKSLQSTGTLEVGNPLNPYYDAQFIRAKLFGPSIDFRRIVGNITRIREEVYRLPKYNNSTDERKMDRRAEGAMPRMMELDYQDQTLQFQLFRKGIEATYDYLNSSQTRVSMIRNAIEEVAEQHRIALFELVVTEIEKKLPTANEFTRTGGAANKITFNQWLRFRKRFGSLYSPDIVLGNSEAITQFELMFADFSLGDANGTQVPVGQLSQYNSGLVRNPQLLNNVPTVPEYGWYDDLSTDIIEPNKLLVFDRERSSNLVFQIGSDQDETKREPGPRVIQRFLATKAGVEVPDPNGIFRYNMGS